MGNNWRFHAWMLCFVSLSVGVLFSLYAMTIGLPISGFIQGLLVIGVIIPFILFRGWGKVFTWVGNGMIATGRAAQPYAVAVGGHVRSNPLLWLTIVLFGTSLGLFVWAICYENVKAAWNGVFFFELAIVSAITYFNAWDKWRVWQFIFLLFNSMLAIFVGGLSWGMYLFLTALLVFSVSVMFNKEKELAHAVWKGFTWLILQLTKLTIWAVKVISSLLVDLLSGKWGWGIACLTGSMILLGFGFILISAGNIEAATVSILGAVSLFIGFAVLGVKTLVK